MPATVEAALLGVVHGLTELLPVSSSAHHIPARAFFGYDVDVVGVRPVGIVSSANVEYLAIRTFLHDMASHGLDPFAWYRLAPAACAVTRIVSRVGW